MKYFRDSKMTLATVIYEINMLLVRVSQITTKKFSSSMFGKRDWMRTLSSIVDDKRPWLVDDCYMYKMDLVTNGVVITNAIKFVQQKKKELKATENTTNRVF